MWPLFVQRLAADFVHMLRRGTDHPDARYLPSILSFTLSRFLFSAFIPPLLLPLLLSFFLPHARLNLPPEGP